MALFKLFNSLSGRPAFSPAARLVRWMFPASPGHGSALLTYLLLSQANQHSALQPGVSDGCFLPVLDVGQLWITGPHLLSHL